MAIKKETKYTVEQFRPYCKALFGVSTAHFDGATHGVTGSYTKDEMKSIITEWSSRKAGSPKKEDEE